MTSRRRSVSNGYPTRRARRIVSEVPRELRLELAKQILIDEAKGRYDSAYFSLNGNQEGWVIAVVKRNDPQPLMQNILDQIARQDLPRKTHVDVMLSRRREDTLQQLLLGRSEKEAANTLGISKHTVHVHVKAIYRAYGVSSRAELMALLLRARGDELLQDSAA